MRYWSATGISRAVTPGYLGAIGITSQRESSENQTRRRSISKPLARQKKYRSIAPNARMGGSNSLSTQRRTPLSIESGYRRNATGQTQELGDLRPLPRSGPLCDGPCQPSPRSTERAPPGARTDRRTSRRLGIRLDMPDNDTAVIPPGDYLCAQG